MGRPMRIAGPACAALLVGASLAACGSSANDSSATAAATTAQSPAVKAARDAITKYSGAQPAITVPPIRKPVPSGRTVAIVTCPLPVCKTETDAAANAARKIGWKVRNYVNPLTPEGYVALWNSLLQTPPDAIAYVGVLPNSIIAKQLERVQRLKIPAVGIAPAGDKPDPSGPMKAAYASAPQFRLSGQLMGNAVVADAGSGPKTVFVWDKNIGLTWGPIKDGFTQVVTGAGGSVDVLNVPNTEIGKSAPAQIVSYVQAHPDVKYVALALNDYAIGLAQALAAANLAAKVKVVSRAPQAANLKDVRTGGQFATVGEENDAGGWRAIDGLIRLMVGADMSCCTEPTGWHQLLTKSNVTETSTPPVTPGSPDAFLKAWGISG
jgi:ribose transport system substrate-binding protein